MQTLTEKVWNLNPPDGLFNKTVLSNLFPSVKENALKFLINKSLRHKEIIRLKPNMYCLSEKYRRSDPHPFVVAGMLLSPSYVSLESALWHHDLIPEALFQVGCMTTLRTRTYRNPLGTFSYYSIASKNFKAGVRAVRFKGRGWAFMAEPLRAIADMIYLNKKVSWDKEKLDYLVVSLRIEKDRLKEISMKNYNEISDSMTNRRVRDYLFNLKKAIKHV
ncbi:MAG: hypothetical protein PHF84_09610 [bacterium]|nr:hypothetical protein [bacterium]